MYDIVTAWHKSDKFPKSTVKAWLGNVLKHVDPQYNRVRVLTAEEDVEGFENFVERPKHPEWPGWWSKINLFCRNTPALYLDLDTRLTKPPMSEVATLTSPIIGLDDERIPGVFGSGILWIRPHTKIADYLYKNMVAFSEDIMKAYVVLPHFYGDQGYIAQAAKVLGEELPRWQKVFRSPEFYCATPDVVKRPWQGETFVYLSGEAEIGRLDDPEAAWNK